MMLQEISQSPKDKSSVILLMCDTKNSQIQKESDGCQGLGTGVGGVQVEGGG